MRKLVLFFVTMALVLNSTFPVLAQTKQAEASSDDKATVVSETKVTDNLTSSSSDKNIARLSGESIGESRVTILSRPGDSKVVYLAVPKDMVLTGYTGRASIPGAVGESQITIKVGGEIVYETVIQGGETKQLEVEFPPVQGEAQIEFSAQESQLQQLCTSTVIEPEAVRITGEEYLFEKVNFKPSTVSEFLPPYLDQAVVVLPAEPNLEELSAAYELGAALARRYPKTPEFVVRLDEIAFGGSPFSRTFVIESTAGPQMEIEETASKSYLRMSGAGAILPQIARTLSEPEINFVTSSKADAQVMYLAEEEAEEEDLFARRSLEDIGVRRRTASESRVLEIPIGLSQSVFGDPVSSINLRLGGLVSFNPEHEPTLSLWINGDLMTVVDFDEKGRFDIEFEVTEDEIQRDNIVVLRSETSLDCGDPLPIHSLQLDSGSWVQAERGQTLNLAMDLYPQYISEDFLISAGSAAHETESVMTVVAAMQASSAIPVKPVAVRSVDVLGTASAGMILTDGERVLPDFVSEEVLSVKVGALGLISEDANQDLFLSTVFENSNQSAILLVIAPAELNDPAKTVIRNSGWSIFAGETIGINKDQEVFRSGVTVASNTQLAALNIDTEYGPLRLFGIGMLLVIFVTGLYIGARVLAFKIRRS